MSRKNNAKTVLETQQIPWINLGTIDATAGDADVALAVTERDFASAKLLDNVVYWKVPYGINTTEVRFILTTNNDDVDIDVWAGRIDSDDDAEMSRVCTLDVICGQQDANDSTHHYADTINITNNKWISTVSAVVPGTDQQARLVLDLCGYDLLLFHGYGTVDADTLVEVSGY